MNNSRITSREAILVMDSRNTSAAVRSQNFAGAWTQLYKANDYYLDINCKPETFGAQLVGKLVGVGVAPSSGTAKLLTEDGKVASEARVSESGMFRLAIQQTGVYRLEVDLSDDSYVISKLNLN